MTVTYVQIYALRSIPGIDRCYTYIPQEWIAGNFVPSWSLESDDFGFVVTLVDGLIILLDHDESTCVSEILKKVYEIRDEIENLGDDTMLFSVSSFGR